MAGDPELTESEEILAEVGELAADEEALAAYRAALGSTDLPVVWEVSADGIRVASATKPLRHRVDFRDDRDDRPEHVALLGGVPSSVEYDLVRLSDEVRATEASAAAADTLVAAIEEGEDNFFVRFSCRGCAADNQQPDQDLVFSEEVGASNTVRFAFTPALPEAGAVGLTEIAFEITRNGLTYDQVIFRACTAASEGELGACLDSQAPVRDSTLFTEESSGLIQPGEAFYDARRAGGAAPDIHVRLLRRGIDADVSPSDPRPFVTRVDIYDDELIAALQARNVASRNLKSRRPGVATYEFTPGVERFEGQDLSFYLQLTCLALPQVDPQRPPAQLKERERFRLLLEDDLGPIACARPPSPPGTGWRREDTTYLGGELARIGREVRKLLFPTEEDGVFIEVLAQLAADRLAEGRRPLKLLFDAPSLAPDVYMPVQLLHPPSAFDIEQPRFFGLVFDLANKPDAFPSGSPGVAISGHMRHLAFAGYTDDLNEDDAIGAMSLSHYSAISGGVTSSGGTASPLISDSSAFVSYLTQHRSAVDVIWAYSHGDSRGWSRAVDYATVSGAQSLVLGRRRPDGRYDRLTAYKLSQISAAGDSLRAFSNAPLVMLIACETNAPNLGGTGSRALVQELTELGASSVVTTEAEINAASATLFGVSFLSELRKPDQGPSLAMLQSRRALYEQRGDLWGLLFAYNGAHGWLALIS